MKKLILAIAIIVIFCWTLTAQDGFNLYGFGSIDYYPTYIDNMIDISINDEFITTTIGIGIVYNYDILNILVEAGVYSELNRVPDILSFSPTYAEYTLDLNVWYGPFGVIYSYKYNHLIDTPDLSRAGGFNKIAIEFDTRKIK